MAGRSRGFSLLEVLLALAITLVVMALVGQTMSAVRRVFRDQTARSTAGNEALLVVDDIALELAQAGQGLGDATPAVLGRLPGQTPNAATLTIRSNPLGVGWWVERVEAPAGADTKLLLNNDPNLPAGTGALLVNAGGRHELVEIVDRLPAGVSVRSLESDDGELSHRFGPQSGGRLLGLREVRYFEREIAGAEPGRREVVKSVLGVSERVLARGLDELSFALLDDNGDELVGYKAEEGDVLRTVHLAVSSLETTGSGASRLSTAVTLPPSSATIDFEDRSQSLRWSRVFYPVAGPTSLVSPPGATWGALIGSGARPKRDPAAVSVFQLERRFMGAGVDHAFFLDDVRAPVAAVIAPTASPLSGSMIVAAWGLRVGHLSRIEPDAAFGFSHTSTVTTFSGTEALAQAGGICFGVDGALYLTSREKGGIYRLRFGERGTTVQAERLFDLPGTPGALEQGADGYLYFLMHAGDEHALWRMSFDETLSPVAPIAVGALPGRAISLASDPIAGGLWVLLETARQDHAVVTLSRSWVSRAVALGPDAVDAPEISFSLARWQDRLESASSGSMDLPLSLVSALGTLRPQRLDLIAFDAAGSLYLGSREDDLVLQFELPRPSGRYAVGLAATVVDRGAGLPPEIRMHAWKKSALAY